MKKLTTILLTIFALACNGQEPDVSAYSTGLNSKMMDSVKAATIDSINNVYQTKIDSLNQRIDFLMNMAQSIPDLIKADTLKLNLYDDNISIIVDKKGSNTWVDIIEGNNRLNADYVNGKNSIIIADSLTTIGSLSIDKTNKIGSSYVNFR